MRTQEKKIQILEQFAINAGAYYSFNLTQNRIPGVVCQKVKGKVYNVNKIAGLPEDAELTEYLAFWGNRLLGEEKKSYFSFFDLDNFTKHYENGETHLTYTYWTETVAMQPMLAEQHVFLFEDEETGEIQGITYIIDQTEKNKEKIYRRNLEANNEVLVRELEDRLEQEHLQNEVLSALGRNYHAIFMINLQKDSYRVISCRDVIRHYYNMEELSASKMLGEVCEKIVADEYILRMSRFFDIRTAAERLHDREFTEAECITKEGNWHRARLIVRSRDEAGNVTHILYVTQIIDAEKEFEERLRARAEDADFANQAKTDFISKVAHDIRTPMNSIFGFLEIAEANLGDWDKVQYSLEKIRSAGEFLKDLVNDVLDISHMEKGMVKLCPEVINFTDMMEEFAVSMQNAKFDKAQQFDFEIKDVVHNWILADPLRLRQIYSNVLSNAIKYTPDGGHIEFRLYQERLPQPDQVRVTAVIADDGIGMSEEFMKKMFNKFERATDTRVNTVSGYGLGLAIVKQLVNLMNGSMEVKSSPGEGTTVWIQLDFPCVPEPAEESDSLEKTDSAVCAGMHLLVAEDNELNQEVITELLAMYDISCDCAGDGRICVERFQNMGERAYDAILMDVQMPHMNGIEAVRCIRALPLERAKTVPIFAMTANALKEDIQVCLDAGMDQHLSKPIDMKQLLKLLAEIKR